MKVLNIVKNVLDEFNKNNIKYCHFKSNEHVDAAVIGDTDLDILFDYSQYNKIRTLLLNLGFKQFNTAWFVSYPYVEDYLAIDNGKIVHIHAHFKLILGESKVKSYILPWEKELFKNRVFIEEYNIYTSSPVEEMLLLIIRTSLKLPSSNINYENKRDIIDSRREFTWLKNIVSKQEIIKISSEKFDITISESIEKIYDENINYENIKSFYLIAKKYLDLNRRYSYLQSKFSKVTRRIAQLFFALNRKFGIIKTLRNHRTFQDKGLVIAIMGSDGSGKSTQVKNIKNILSKKMDIRYVYMGSGDGPSSWHRNILIWLQKIFFKKKKNNYFIKEPQLYTDIKKVDFTKKDILKIIYALSLAIEKRTKLKLIQKYKNKGMIVVTDRYPQTSIYGYNDGPLIADYLTSNNKLLSFLSQIEFNSYEYAKFVYPDIVIKLLGNPEIIHSRRADEMSLEQIIKKQNGIKSIDFTDKTKVVDIDATLSIDEVTIQIMEQISNSIGSKNE